MCVHTCVCVCPCRHDGRDYMQHCAVYCQDWDPSGKRLIVGGGPLAIGLQGCYGALWS